MPSFRNGDVEIAYLDEGEGEPIVLVHGFASNKDVTGSSPAGSPTLTRAGRRVIALDNRGHGASTKLYDPAAYHMRDHGRGRARAARSSQIARADVMGYSMGARITAFLALAHPRARALGDPRRPRHRPDRRRRSAGEHRRGAGGAVARRCTDPTGRMFRAFAEQTKSDLQALAACLRGSRQTLSAREVGRIALPVLVAVGTNDTSLARLRRWPR